jgi:hypothetical protein
LSAQAIDSLNQETILKSWNVNNPYIKSQTRWLDKNGFNTKQYSWDNISINNHLERSLKVRSAGFEWALTSALSFLISSK